MIMLLQYIMSDLDLQSVCEHVAAEWPDEWPGGTGDPKQARTKINYIPLKCRHIILLG